MNISNHCLVEPLTIYWGIGGVTSNQLPLKQLLYTKWVLPCIQISHGDVVLLLSKLMMACHIFYALWNILCLLWMKYQLKSNIYNQFISISHSCFIDSTCQGSRHGDVGKMCETTRKTNYCRELISMKLYLVHKRLSYRWVNARKT